jgi:hypothetical protein
LTVHNPIRFDGTSPEAFVASDGWRNTLADGGKSDLLAWVSMNTVDASYLVNGHHDWFFGYATDVRPPRTGSSRRRTPQH